jgi:rubrerythrin
MNVAGGNALIIETKGGGNITTWKCKSCGFSKEGRCKPQKCPQCQRKGGFEKEE